VFKELIWIKENSLTEEFCKSVIDKFETDPYREAGKVNQNNPRIDPSVKLTIDTGVTTNIAWKKEDEILYKALSIALDEYNDYLMKYGKESLPDNGCKLYPAQNYRVKDTGYKVQKYEPNGYYHWHHDWCLHNGWSRIFTYIWYLNTVKEEDGGWTEFVDGTKIQPKVGSILFFPATWTYVHRGYTTKVPKYLCNGWIYARP
tara:strand:+ start:34 stop:639 length:606 start_codon:yes stop_codon:yes gene_type:complete